MSTQSIAGQPETAPANIMNFLGGPVGYMEDEPLTRDQTVETFKQIGIDVSTLDSEADAMNHAEQSIREKPALFILDINLGNGKSKLGLKIARRIKTKYKNAFVVLLSSKLKNVSEEDLKHSSADCVVEKNDSIVEDVKSIESHLNSLIGKSRNQSFDVSSPLRNNFYNVQYSESKLTPEILRKIDDPFVPSDFVKNNIATGLLNIKINSKEQISADSATEVLSTLAGVKVNIPYSGDFSSFEKELCCLMVLFPKTGILNSFGGELSFTKDYISTTPCALDFLDTNCDESIYGNNEYVVIDIDCYIFGVFS